MKREAIIIGYSGHAFVLIDILIANKYKILGYCEKVRKVDNPYDLNYLGYEKDTSVLKILKEHKAFIGIGDNELRGKTFEYLRSKQIDCPGIIHPSATVSAKVKIGFATLIMAGVVINSGAEIGNGVICNSSSIIEHQCIVGNYTHIAPGAVVAGNVCIGRNTFVGANAVIKQNLTIGSNVVIGAGGVIVKDIPDGLTVYGNPAKQKTI